jgi:hypothetical protein
MEWVWQPLSFPGRRSTFFKKKMRRTFSGDNILQLYLVVPSNGKLEIPTPTVGIWGDRRPRSPPFLYSVDDTRGSHQTKKQTFQDMEICTTYERVYVTNTLHLSGSIRIFFKKRTVADNSTKTS